MTLHTAGEANARYFAGWNPHRVDVDCELPLAFSVTQMTRLADLSGSELGHSYFRPHHMNLPHTTATVRLEVRQEAGCGFVLGFTGSAL